MASTNTQNPDCPNCNKSGLAILPVRYAVVPADVDATLPAPLGNKVTNVALTHYKYALRTLRKGFIYLLHEKHPRGSQIKWEVYSVSERGTLWKQLATTAIQSISDDPACSRSGHNIPASIIAIEKPENCARVWIAFSEHAWSEETFKLFEQNAAQRDKRMQTFLPATWIKDKGYRHGMEATQANVETVIEYQRDFKISSLAGNWNTDISRPDGTHDELLLKRQTTRYPMCLRRDQGKKLVDLMNEVGEQPKAENNTPIVIALWDAVGITHELNGYRNDAAGWIAEYGKQRELQLTAINLLEGVKKAVETRDAQQARYSAEPSIFHWTRAASQQRLANYDKQHPDDAAGHARQADLCARWEQDARHKIPKQHAQRRESWISLPETEWRQRMAGIDRAARINVPKTAKQKIDMQEWEDRVKREENIAIAEAWPKYQKRIDQFELNLFNKNYNAFLTSAGKLIDERTDDLIVWLESKSLLNSLTEYSAKNLEDGGAFEDVVGDMIFGISSSPNGAIKISSWVKEAKATESNFLWRAIAMNQEQGIEDVNAALAAAVANTGIPFTEQSLNTARDSTKHIAKLADLSKKALSLHNALRKPGVIRIRTGGIEKIFMTVGERFFQPFVKKGADLLSEKFVQSLLLARAGAAYTNVMGLMLAEAKFGRIGRTETLMALSMGHVIASRNASSGFKQLRDAWANLVSAADTPKHHLTERYAGSFNEARELRFAMVATLLQGVFAWKLAQDAEIDPKNATLKAELLAARLSFAGGVIDFGATAIKGLHNAKDLSMSFQVLKLSGGVLSAGSAWIAVVNDLNTAYKHENRGHYDLANVFQIKAAINFISGACWALSTLSYASPALELFAQKFPQAGIGRVAGFLPRLGSWTVARLFAGRAILMLAGMWFSVAVVAIQVLILTFSDDELQIWCSECAFGMNKRNRKTTAKAQLDSLDEALKEGL